MKKLSRINLKAITGGEKSCIHSIQGSDGKWITLIDTCQKSSLGIVSYCETRLGEFCVLRQTVVNLVVMINAIIIKFRI